MSIEQLALACLPLLFGSLILCLGAGKQAIYARASDSGSGSLLIPLVVVPVFLYGFNMVAMRPLDAGNDTPRYIDTYNQLDGITSAFHIGLLNYGNTELLWWPIQAGLHYVLSPRAWLIANYVLVFAFTALFYRKGVRSTGIRTEVFALVFLTFFIVYSGNIMRQALAVPVGALGFYLFFERKYLLAGALIAVATGLHWSAVVLFIAPFLASRFFDRNRTYLILPLLALGLSTLASPIIGHAVNLFGIPGISDKFSLYFLQDHQSHIEAIWKTANFWICMVSSLAFLLISPASSHVSQSTHKYTTLLVSLILFGINSTDFSERYIPFLLLIIPLQAALTIDRLKLANAMKNIMFLGAFLLIATLVLFAQSSQYTLGYSL